MHNPDVPTYRIIGLPGARTAARREEAFNVANQVAMLSEVDISGKLST